MSNLPLQPLVWFDYGNGTASETRSALHEYDAWQTDDDTGWYVGYFDRRNPTGIKEATGFATIDEAKQWAWNHYNEKMQPYLDASRYPAQFQEVFEVIEDCRNREVSIPDGFVVTFRDVPEANTQGDTFIEAVEMAQDALQTAMEFYDEDNKPRPKPSAAIHGDVMIDINSEVQSD